MAAVLNTNVASLWASKNLQGAQTKMADSVERLSSGLRINRASDDAAGLGIGLFLVWRNPNRLDHHRCLGHHRIGRGDPLARATLGPQPQPRTGPAIGQSKA